MIKIIFSVLAFIYVSALAWSDEWYAQQGIQAIIIVLVLIASFGLYLSLTCRDKNNERE